MCVGRSSGLMYGNRVWCKIVERGVESLGNFMSSLLAGRMRMAPKGSIAVRKCSFVPVLSLLGSLVVMTLVGFIRSV